MALVVAIMYFYCFYIVYVRYFFVIDKSDIWADDASLIIKLFFYNGKIKGTNTLKTCICFGLCLCVWSDSVDLTVLRVYI